ncbi:MAG: hypothetical protein ACRYGK_07740, partial [Janthinobacterium lividum]
GREPLLSDSWEKTQAVDYTLQQENFLTTVNRVYGNQAGSKPLFPDQRQTDAQGRPLYQSGSGKTISWDAKRASASLHGKFADFVEGESRRRSSSASAGVSPTSKSATWAPPARDRSPIAPAALAAAGPDANPDTGLESGERTGQRAFGESISSLASTPSWLQEFVRRASSATTLPVMPSAADATFFSEPVLFEEPEEEELQSPLTMRTRVELASFRMRQPRRSLKLTLPPISSSTTLQPIVETPKDTD